MSLLYNEPPVAVSPTLMTIFGVPEAMFLQQVHYWIENKKNNASKYKNSFVGGYWWVYNSLTEWQALLPYLGSESTIKRIIADLKSKGVLVIEKHNAHGFDKTNWYRINYIRLNQMVDQFNSDRALGQNDLTTGSDLPNAQGENEPVQSVSLNQPIPETTQRLQTKTTTEIDHAPSASALELFDYTDQDYEQDQKAKYWLNGEPQTEYLAAAACGNVEKRKLPRGGHDPEGFAKFWAQYPRKTAKANAQSAWNRLKANAELQATILHDLAQRKQNDHQWRDVAFVPHPATYLNGKRWEDEIVKPSSPPPMPRHAQQQNDDAHSQARLNAIARLRGQA